MKMKIEDIARGLGISHKTDSVVTTTNVGNKVSPITINDSSSSANNDDERCPNLDIKKQKAKTISRLKELIKWAAAHAQAEKGGKYIGRKVLHLKNRAALKGATDNGQLNDESPKISFRWEVGSCSTTYSASLKHDQILRSDSSSSTPLHVTDHWVARSGSWITTDSEFVVLEL